MTPYYEKDGITIYNGDCRDVVPRLDVKYNRVLTDPPYSPTGTTGESRIRAAVTIGLNAALTRLREKDCAVVVCASSGRSVEWVLECCHGALPFNRVLTWDRHCNRTKVIAAWRWDSVLALVFGSPSSKTGSVHRSVLKTDGPLRTETGHPVALPMAVSKWLYEPIDDPNAIVLDPFMGSGSLLAPAAALGRRVIGIELEEKYCEIAATRLDQGFLDFDARKVGG